MDSLSKAAHNEAVMSWLNSDRSNAKEFTDAKLKCDGREFPVHKNILASLSEFFKAMFTTEMSEKYKDSFEIKDVSAENMEAILNFAYTGEIEIDQENVFDIYATANYLLISSLERKCNLLVPKLNPRNALKIWNKTRKVGLNLLEQKCDLYMKQHFPILKDDATISLLEFGSMKALMQITQPNNCESEEAALIYLQNWILADLENRKKHFGELFLLKSWENVQLRFWAEEFKLKKVCSEFPKCAAELLEIMSAQYKSMAQPDPLQRLLVMNQDSTILRMFNLKTREDKILSARTERNCEAGFVAHQNYVYQIAGFDNTQEPPTIYNYRIDLENPSAGWIKHGYLVTKRRKCGVTVLNDTIYAVGGINTLTENNLHPEICGSDGKTNRLKPCKNGSFDAAKRNGMLLAFNYEQGTCEVYDVTKQETIDTEHLSPNTIKALVLNDNLHLLSIEDNELLLKVGTSRDVYEHVEPNLVHVSKLQDACVAHGKIVVAVISDTSQDGVEAENLLRIYERDLSLKSWRFVFETTEVLTYFKLIPFTLD